MMGGVTEDISITGGGVRLGQLLKLANVVEGGGDVKALLAGGLVYVNDEVETRRGRQLVAGDLVEVEGYSLRVVDA